MKNIDSKHPKLASLSRIPRSETLTHISYERIKDLLVSGKMEKNVIYPASQFAEMLGVSRTPVREALLQLESEGYLDFITGRGFCLRNFTVQEIKEFFEFRKMVEPAITKNIVEKISSKELAKLNSIVEKMDSMVGKDADRLIQYDSQFHMMLLEKFGNRYLLSVMENVRGLLAILGLRSIGISGRDRAVIDEHKDITEAITNADGEAAETAMLRHLDSTEKNLLITISE